VLTCFINVSDSAVDTEHFRANSGFFLSKFQFYLIERRLALPAVLAVYSIQHLLFSSRRDLSFC
jgi:hypothetical protein